MHTKLLRTRAHTFNMNGRRFFFYSSVHVIAQSHARTFVWSETKMVLWLDWQRAFVLHWVCVCVLYMLHTWLSMDFFFLTYTPRMRICTASVLEHAHTNSNTNTQTGRIHRQLWFSSDMTWEIVSGEALVCVRTCIAYGALPVMVHTLHSIQTLTAARW